MNKKPAPQVAAIVLAAGGSARMGQLKQLLPIDGQPMVRHVTEAVCAANLAQVVVVVGARAGTVEEALAGLSLDIVVNEQWPAGLSTSVQAGVQALRPEIQAALMVLADQPNLTPNLLKTLVARYQATEAPIVAPCYQSRRGNPVLIDRSLFSELAAVEGDQGGRALFARHRGEIEWVEIGDPAVMQDIDTPEEYQRLGNKADPSQ